MAILIQLVMMYLACLKLTFFLTLALGMFVFVLSFAKDMMDDVHSINKSVKTEKTKSHILKQLIGFIDMYSDVKELSIYMQ